MSEDRECDVLVPGSLNYVRAGMAEVDINGVIVCVMFDQLRPLKEAQNED